jgi:hypothetical protein
VSIGVEMKTPSFGGDSITSCCSDDGKRTAHSHQEWAVSGDKPKLSIYC